MSSSRGRGRGGRGGTGLTFSLESIGINRGDFLPPPILKPPDLYPTLDVKAIPPKINDIDNYLLTLKQEFRTALSSSNYYINPVKDDPKIERYSDKYESNAQTAQDNVFHIEWRLFPNELHSDKKVIPKKSRQKVMKIKNLDDLNADEKDDDKEDEEKNDNDDDDVADEEKDADEDIEEGNDYTLEYFDNGEDYLDDSDDNLDEGPTY